MQKIIFLDIDGVLNSERWHTEMTKNAPKDRFGYEFDPTAVSNLAKIVEETEADIVISSSWKCFGLDGMQEMWETRNLPGEVIGITPNTISDELQLSIDIDGIEDYNLRGREIDEWMRRFGEDVSQYVIIDDIDCFLSGQQNHLVLTDPRIGLNDLDATKAIMILNGITNDGK
ncbi:MAG: hypothetical protein J6Z41_04085 [Prevotella sp.]|nr:hypothetical protein [Prevotella sp.]